MPEEPNQPNEPNEPNEPEEPSEGEARQQASAEPGDEVTAGAVSQEEGERGQDAAAGETADGAEAQEAQEPPIEVEAAAPPVATSALSGAVAALQQGRAKDRDRLLRTAAEFENFKKRARRDARDGARRAEERVVLEFLPVVDNLERAFDHTDSDAQALLEGVRMVHKQFLATLEKYDIKPFESVGQPFSPERHEAVQQMSSELPAAVVCQQLQKGYLRGEHLVRPAMVIVSTGPAQAAPPDEQEQPPATGEEATDVAPEDADKPRGEA